MTTTKTTIRLVVSLLFLCGTIVGSNDTFDNRITQEEEEEVVSKVHATKDKIVRNRSLEKIFKNAVQAYLEEDWHNCIEGFNEALHGYKTYKRMVVNCRQKCRMMAAGSWPMLPENIEDLHFYEKKVRETLCLLTCNQDYREIAGSKALNRLSWDTEQKFVDCRVYEYLHICYYKNEQYQKAANALFTFLVKHPEHEASVESLKHYLTLPGVDEEKIVNLEAPRFTSTYFKGVQAYEEEDYVEAIALFETSLRSYMEEEEECRTYCEGPFDQGWHPEFTSSIANHFAYCLKCKHSCARSLNNVNGDYRSDILRSHYNYLQFAYYKLGNLKGACKAVESFLLFAPQDETMLHNKDYYGAQPKVKEEYFLPREEALSYVKRQEYERKLLRFISDEFMSIDKRLGAYNEKIESGKKKSNEKEAEKELGKETRSTILHPPPGHSPSSRARFVNLTIRNEEETGGLERVAVDVRLIAEEEELGGKNRYVADGFLNSTDCQTLMQLALNAAIVGDGYEENKSPHSVYEKFEGITIGRAALMVYYGQMEPKDLEVLLERTEDARSHVERYFELDRRLYFTYTHLVCRTALPEAPKDRDDLSHQIHADNCLLRDLVCYRESPAYVWRDYSAIVYLNDDFQGGEFFFAKDAKSKESRNFVKPRCGRMVAFSAGGENLHGVNGVLSGRRCAMALWFTQDEKYMEYERILARTILQRVRSAGIVDRKDFDVPSRYEDVLIGRFKEDELLAQLLRNSSRV